MKNKDFKVLLVYVNSYMDHLIPISMSVIGGALYKAGFDIKLFDTTYHKIGTDSFGEENRAETGQVKSACLDDGFFPTRATNPISDFKDMVNEYKPDLIGFSIVEPTFPLSIEFVDAVKDLNIPILTGGIHAIFDGEDIIKVDGVDIVCIGEGEDVIVELCEKMAKGEEYTDVANFWFKNSDGTVKKTSNAPLVDFEQRGYVQPYYDMFEKARFYRPMSGKIYKMLPVEFSRGCPYQCTYCSAPALNKHFSDSGKWLRMKPINIIEKEIKFAVENYDIEYFYFVSETFLSISDERFEEFIEMFRKYKIPFWFNTRPESITEYKIKKLQEVGCHRISIGVESGNEWYRYKMLKRGVKNEKMIEKLKIIEKSGIEFSVNNIIGMPEETREFIFDTININREFIADSHSVLIFQPYRGTFLYNFCVDKGYYDKDSFATDILVGPVIKNPNLSDSEIMGLYRTFNLYVKLPKEDWPEIEKAEKLDEVGNIIFKKLMKKFKIIELKHESRKKELKSAIKDHQNLSNRRHYI